MRVISVNTNGIRAAARKGFFDWLPRQRADFICVQETKAQVDQLDQPIFHPKNYFCNYYDALKKGYSGTAIYSRHKPLQVIRGFGESEFDNEGRYLEYRYQNLSVISLYAPSCRRCKPICTSNYSTMFPGVMAPARDGFTGR